LDVLSFTEPEGQDFEVALDGVLSVLDFHHVPDETVELQARPGMIASTGREDGYPIVRSKIGANHIAG
jgi:hypothetical protein